MRRKSILLFSTVLSLALTLTACDAINNLIPPVDVGLDSALGQFAVEAGSQKEARGTVTLSEIPEQVASGTLELRADAISVTTGATGEKGTTTEQTVNCNDVCQTEGFVDAATCASICDNNTLLVTVHIAEPGAIETVCLQEPRDTYGPFSISLDDDANVLSVSPSTVNLTDNTIDLFRSGSFAACVKVISPVDGEVSIDSLRFRVGL